ncbi:unnamed protein product [Nezara viridula]|uniref:Uncharacterized protein n=1 Tax=Nezara viridula TaxID=85310 RepID=A0A9P0H9K7_NEZVI|nr:unnamed protein product [Nezara viridula]
MDTFQKDLIRQRIQHITPSIHMQRRIRRKVEFKEYLLKTGVQFELAKCLRMLYEEPIKPRDPIDYIGKHIGPPRISGVEYRRLHEKLLMSLQRIKELNEELEWYKAGRSNSNITEDSENFISTSIFCPSPSSEDVLTSPMQLSLSLFKKKKL